MSLHIYLPFSDDAAAVGDQVQGQAAFGKGELLSPSHSGLLYLSIFRVGVYVQGDPSACSKPPVDIKMRVASSTQSLHLSGPTAQISSSSQREVWNKLMGHPVF